MFSRAVRLSRAALPIRVASQRVPIAARRSVTTNAAQAQVDKSTIPEVGKTTRETKYKEGGAFVCLLNCLGITTAIHSAPPDFQTAITWRNFLEL